MEVKPAQVEGFLRRVPPQVRAVLLFGSDAGLMRERATALMKSVVPDLGDPFRVVEFAASVLDDDPARLADEAAAIALTGGRRAIRITGAGDKLAELFQGFLTAPLGDALVVVEGRDLNTKSKLVDAFKASEHGAPIACYADEGDALERVIERALAEAKLTAPAEVLAYLTENLGGDRLLTRRELEKLILYVGPGAFQVTLADAEACIGDSSALSLDDLADAAANGNLAALDEALARSYLSGNGPIPVLRAAQRHFQKLHAAAVALANGAEPRGIGKRFQIMWKREAAFGQQLRTWSPARLLQALDILTDAEIECKTTGSADEAVCRHALLRIGRAGQSARR